MTGTEHVEHTLFALQIVVCGINRRGRTGQISEPHCHHYRGFDPQGKVCPVKITGGFIGFAPPGVVQSGPAGEPSELPAGVVAQRRNICHCAGNFFVEVTQSQCRTAALTAADKCYMSVVKLFDIFVDDKLKSENKKSVAYTLTFRNKERTLTDNEVNAAMDKLRARLVADLKFELR